MRQKKYLLDTHALIFWVEKEEVSTEFIEFLDIQAHSPAKMIEPIVSDMIDSTLLPNHHKYPFDRLLIAQANSSNAILVTRDAQISKYSVTTFWI